MQNKKKMNKFTVIRFTQPRCVAGSAHLLLFNTIVVCKTEHNKLNFHHNRYNKIDALYKLL